MHATSVLVCTAWRGIIQRDYFCDLVMFRFAAVVHDRRNFFESEMIISKVVMYVAAW